MVGSEASEDGETGKAPAGLVDGKRDQTKERNKAKGTDEGRERQM